MRMGGVAVSGGEDMEAVKINENKEEEGGGGDSTEVVRWEKYLPRMVFRVLLVEADDSTRQIIAALLRKCNYRVVAVADGLKAWEIIKGKQHKIDLILTEAELPSISGFALLTLVTEHDICKNIPVIMMSSHDSISMVLKCMLKGAADYLIKPVRRNELRNLWQHVWRRHTDPRNLPVPQRKVEVTSENNAASNHSNDCAASMRKNKECNEKGSDAQSSCTTPYLEAESGYVQNMQDISQLKYGSASNLSITEIEMLEECTRLDKESVMHESEAIEKSGTFGSDVVPLNEAYNSTAIRQREDLVCAKIMVQDEGIQTESYKGNANAASETRSCHYEPVEPSSGAIDLIGTFGNRPTCTVRHPNSKDNGTSHVGCNPQLELSLRSCLGGSDKQVTAEKPVLNHSDASAFSWYNNSKTLQPLFPTLPSSKSEGASNSPDSLVDGQTEQANLSFPDPQLGMIPLTGVRSDNICTGYGHFYPSLFSGQSGLTPIYNTKSIDHRALFPFPMNSSIHSNPEIHYSEQGSHLSDKTTYISIDQNMHEQNKLEGVEDLRTGSPAAGQSACDSLYNGAPEIHYSEQGSHLSDKTTYKSIDQTVHEQNKLEGVEDLRPGSPAAGQSACDSLCNGAGNHISSSAYGSICSSSDGNATLAVAGEMATASESLNDSSCFVREGFGGVDSLRSSQREAALLKFRLKRKDRCFEKKVRYQSRKLLAEQRPRVKGQFVHRVHADSAAAGAVGS